MSIRSRAALGSRGFSLLEVIIALAILAVAIVSLVQLFSISLRSTKKSSDYTTAIVHARSLLEEAYSASTVDEISGEFQFEGGFQASRSVVAVEKADEEGKAQVYEITVAVTWPAGSLTVSGRKVYGEEEP